MGSNVQIEIRELPGEAHEVWYGVTVEVGNRIIECDSAYYSLAEAIAGASAAIGTALLEEAGYSQVVLASVGR